MPTTNVWSSSFAPAKFSVTGGGFTTTATQHNATDTNIAEVHHSTGKWYFEITAASSGADLAWGIATFSNFNGSALWTTGVALRNGASGWRIDSTNTPTSGPIPNNETLGFAVDFDNSLIWFRQTSAPGIWYGNNATGDPALGTNGLSFTTAVGFGSEMYIAFTSNQNGIDESVTLNSGNAAFIAAAPAGFLSWDDVIVPNFVHVAQVNREVLSEPDPAVRVSYLPREVLLTNDPKVQLVEYVREVLKSVNIGLSIGVQVDIAELWFAPDVFIDFSVPSNRALFHDDLNRPIPLDNDGSLPTGTAPLLYFTQGKGDLDPYDFPLNASGNGAMEVRSTDGKGLGYGIAPTSPTDIP